MSIPFVICKPKTNKSALRINTSKLAMQYLLLSDNALFIYTYFLLAIAQAEWVLQSRLANIMQFRIFIAVCQTSLSNDACALRNNGQNYQHHNLLCGEAQC